jgi:hypothetical protein
MDLNSIKLEIEGQLKNQTNYIKNNACKIFEKALTVPEMDRVKTYQIIIIKNHLFDAVDPWTREGIPSQKETAIIVIYLKLLQFIIYK